MKKVVGVRKTTLAAVAALTVMLGAVPSVGNAEPARTELEEASIATPEYENVEVRPGDSLFIPSPLTAAGLDPEDYYVSSRYSFPHWLTLHPNGALTAEQAGGANPQDWTTHYITIEATHRESNERFTMSFTIDLKNENWFGLATQNEPGELPVSVPRGMTITLPPLRNSDGSPLPPNTVIELDAGAPEWLNVDPDTGVVTTSPSSDTPTNRSAPGHGFTITYADGSQDRSMYFPFVGEISHHVHVSYNGQPSVENFRNVSVSEVEVTQGEEGIIAAPEFSLPSNSEALSYSFDEQPVFQAFDLSYGEEHTPEWATVRPDGSIEVAPPSWIEPGMKFIPVQVLFGDNSTQRVSVGVRILPQEEDNQQVQDENASSPFDGSSLLSS